MASFVIEWCAQTTCTSAIRLSKKVLVLDGETPLMDSDISRVFKAAKPGIKVILQEKTDKWIGVLKSKWDKYRFMEHLNALDLQ